MTMANDQVAQETGVSRDRLIAAALAATRHAHAPYSGYGVGAALALDDGRIVTGANVENASYGMTLCAETVAVAKAANEGDLRRIVAVAVIGGMLDPDGKITGEQPVRPCGRCRQILNESASLSGKDLDVHCSSADGSAIETYKLSELLPHAFGPGDLGLT